MKQNITYNTLTELDAPFLPLESEAETLYV